MEVVVAKYKILSQHLPGVTEKNSSSSLVSSMTWESNCKATTQENRPPNSGPYHRNHHCLVCIYCYQRFQNLILLFHPITRGKQWPWIVWGMYMVVLLSALELLIQFNLTQFLKPSTDSICAEYVIGLIQQNKAEMNKPKRILLSRLLA